MPEYVVTRYLTRQIRQVVLVKGETEEDALRLSQEDDADAIMILTENENDTYEIENEMIQTPEAASEEYANAIRVSGMHPVHAEKAIHTFRRWVHLSPYEE